MDVCFFSLSPLVLPADAELDSFSSLCTPLTSVSEITQIYLYQKIPRYDGGVRGGGTF